MSANNPLMPQGSLEEQKPRNKSNIYIAVFAILAFHVVLLGALLLQGCQKSGTPTQTADNALNPLSSTNIPPAPDLGLSNPLSVPTGTASTLPPAPLPPPIGVNVTPGSSPGMDIASPPPPVMPPPVVTPPPPGATEHTIAQGDTFATIAKKYNLTINAIAKANPGVDSRKLKLGQKIKLPESGAGAVAAPSATADAGAIPASAAGHAAAADTYVVKKGDNLTKIAKAHGVTINQIKTANNLKTTSLQIGSKLKIPAKAGTNESVVPTPSAAAGPASASYVTPLPRVAHNTSRM